MGKFSRIVVSVALVLSIGMHWNFLQVVAWGGMLVKYAQEGSLKSAIEKTFDGEHPCCLCKAIKQGQDEERKSPQQKTETKKPDLFLSASIAEFFPPCRDLPFLVHNEDPVQFRSPPLVPPPRTG